MGVSSYGQTANKNSNDLLVQIQAELGKQKGVFALWEAKAVPPMAG